MYTSRYVTLHTYLLHTIAIGIVSFDSFPIISTIGRCKRKPKLASVLTSKITRSQAVARMADRTASQQTLVISDTPPMKLHAVNSTSFQLLYRTSIRVNTFAAPTQSLKNITLSPFRKLVRPDRLCLQTYPAISI